MKVEVVQQRDSDSEYREYLQNHIAYVNKAYNEILRPYLVAESSKEDPIITPKEISALDVVVKEHDSVKYSKEEFEPYRDHYYPREETPGVQEEYDRAWLHHQKNEPHHWQYWVLIKDNDKDKYIPLEMYTVSVCEMLCDWSSFHYFEDKKDSTANQWYKDNGKNMILHDNTRKLVEKILEDCPEL